MFKFKKGQLVRRNVSGRYYRVLGFGPRSGLWALLEINTARGYTQPPDASINFTLVGNNYKAKG